MTRPSAAPGDDRPRGLLHATWLRIGLGLAAVLVIGGAAYGGWYLFLRPAGPPPVDLSALPAITASPGASPGAGAAALSGQVAQGSTAPSPAAGLPSSSSSAAPSSAAAASSSSASLDGTWTVDTSIGSGATGLFVGYRVKETLASIGANTAVGRTSAVTGSFTLGGTTITAATITADLTGLQSDNSHRDGQLANRGLETATYPTATFVLGQPVELGSIPAQGQIITLPATGQLTLHGQTRTVTISLQARLSGGVIAVSGSLPITFADYGIVAPTSFLALSVEDHGTMELQLMFRHG